MVLDWSERTLELVGRERVTLMGRGNFREERRDLSKFWLIRRFPTVFPK